MHRHAPGNCDRFAEPLFETTRDLIAENRRLRAELDEAWALHHGNQLRVRAHGLDLLKEAASRLEAGENARQERARQSLAFLF